MNCFTMVCFKHNRKFAKTIDHAGKAATKQCVIVYKSNFVIDQLLLFNCIRMVVPTGFESIVKAALISEHLC